MNHIQSIREKLTEALQPLELEIRDDSALHAGHAGASAAGHSHYRIRVVSERFHGLSRVQRHRLIYEILDQHLKSHIHALQIEAFSRLETTPSC